MFDQNKKEELNTLIAAFKDGDQDAFEEIYKRCQAHIAFVCSQLCDNKEDVEEIVQDTFMAIYKKSQTLRGDTFMAFLRKIAVDGCYDKRKQNNKGRLVGMDELEELAELDEEFLPEESLQNKERQAELLHIINDLPPRQREMIFLYYYAEINTEEIARLYHCTAGNVRSILHKGKNAIRKKMGVPVAGAAIAAVFFTQQTVFAAQYVGVTATAICASATAAGKSTAAVAITAIAASVGVACVGVYIGLTLSATPVPPAVSETNYVAYEYTAAETMPAAIYTPESPTEPTAPVTEAQSPTDEPTPEPAPKPPPAGDPTAPTHLPDEPTPELPTPPPSDPTPTSFFVDDPTSEPDDEPATEPPTPPADEPTFQLDSPPSDEPTPPINAPPLALPPPQEDKPTPEPPTPDEPTPDEPTLEPDPPTPPPTDRTAHILARLAASQTAADTNSILNGYGFRFVTQMRDSQDMLLRFYVLDDGSGDILVGTAVCADDASWAMRFTHYDDKQAPMDVWALLRFME